jgi:hypothetical protein
MERASRLLRKLPLPADTINCEDLVRKAWPRAVGKKVAGHTRAARMVRMRLIVEVEDAVWQRQLFGLSRQILANLEKTLGHGLVEDIEFRVVPPRREPHRAGQIAAALELVPDEADTIADATLRRIYRVSRKKALA